MFNSVLVIFAVFSFGTDFVITETAQQSNEQTNSHTQNFKLPSKDYIPLPDTWEINPSLNSMWAYRPEAVQSRHPSEPLARKILLKTPHALTRLAKSLKFGYDPYFDKGFFEPFERRQRPVTLVTFRKNGFLPRTEAESSTNHDNNIAELQSPYNEISSFWQDDGNLRVNIQ